jgi:hypothetical protein
MASMTRPRRAYLDWTAFSKETPSKVLRGSMMDLHWFLNSGTVQLALRDLFRCAYYVWRWLWSARAAPLKDDRRMLFVVDTPGVGGLLTLFPLLHARPASVKITLAVTDFIHRDPALRQVVDADANIELVNIDRVRGAFQLDLELCRATFALTRRFLRILPTVPLFLSRFHAYTSVAAALLPERKDTCVVLFNERMLPSACISEVARRRGLEVTAVQHGNFVDNYLPILVDRYLTWGRFHSDWVTSRSACNALAIGAPRMDGTASPPVQVHGVAALAEPVHIVFFSQVGSATASPEMISATRRQILQIADNPGFRLTVKLHPLDTRIAWLGEGERAQRVTYLDGRTPLTDALAHADVVCSFYSSVLAEALLWNVPVIQLNPFQESVGLFPSKDGIAAVKSCAELISLVQGLQSSPERLQTFLQHQRSLREGYFANPSRACLTFWEAMLPRGLGATKLDPALAA